MSGKKCQETNFKTMKLRFLHDPCLILSKKPFQEVFKKIDSNGDGVLERNEFLNEDKSGNDYEVKKDKL